MIGLSLSLSLSLSLYIYIYILFFNIKKLLFQFITNKSIHESHPIERKDKLIHDDLKTITP
jgi:hypothetical protein